MLGNSVSQPVERVVGFLMFKQIKHQSKEPNQKLIDGIESLMAKVLEISSIKSDLENFKLQMAEIINQSSKPAKTRENAKPLNRRIGCKDCLENNIAPCRHCFICGKENQK